MGGPENGNFPLLYVVKCPYVGGWVAQKSLKTPLRNIKMAPDDGHEYFHCTVIIYQRK